MSQNLIYDVVKDAAVTVDVPFFYGSGEEIIKEMSLRINAKETVFPAVILFNNYTESRLKHFTKVDNFVILLLKPADKIQGATSQQNESKFNDLQGKLTEIITAFCKDSRIQGITPLAFEHEITRLYTAFGSQFLCELRVNFLNINFINQC